MSAPEFVYTVYIAAPAERVWNALVDGDVTRKYWGHENRSDWQPGSRWEHVRIGPDGVVDIAGKVIEVDPPHRLVQTFRALWNDDVKLEGESRVTWEIEPVGDSCLLRVTHDQLQAGANAQLYGGWPMILSGLKTWLETGETLTTPGSLRYVKSPASAVEGRVHGSRS